MRFGDSERFARALSAALAAPLGALLVAATNAIAIPVFVSLPPAGLALRVAHHTFDAAETLGVGLAFGLLTGLGRWLVERRVAVGLVAYGIASSALMHGILGGDLERQALVALEGTLALPLQILFTILTGLAIVASHLLGAELSRFPRFRFAPLALALGGLVANHLLVPDDYPGLHGAIAWTAATLVGATFAPAVLVSLRTNVSLRRTATILAALGSFGLVVAPPNDVRLELFREPGASAAWLLASTVWSLPEVPPIEAPAPWFRARTDANETPPSAPPLLATAPVVVLLTIDAVRADVIADPANDALLPNLARMKREGVFFAQARSPGSQTSVSLTTTFSGRYFSELRWARYGTGSTRFTYAAADPSPRFPSLLTHANVLTESFLALNFLTNDFGVVRGFGAEQLVAKGRDHAPGNVVVEPLLRRLRWAGPEPLFLYAHLTEPHSPYDRGKRTEGTAFERYVSEIAVADGLVGRVSQLLEQRFRDRWLLIVTSDHGEAFGEHGTTFHTKTLYEELVRVPLLVRGAGVRHRRIDEPVGLVDLGATVLDLFGQPTPAAWKGQSLVPLLAGRDVRLERPLLAEGRLRRALFLGDLKIIEDLRRKTVELYDLASDPRELRSIFDAQDPTSREALGLLRAFFDAHALRAEGYAPPYKP
jgi:arylsulfatase A-like enzyme